MLIIGFRMDLKNKIFIYIKKRTSILPPYAGHVPFIFQ